MLAAQFIAAFLLAALMWIALWQTLYWRFWWFDIPMHLLGGVWAALCVSWVLARRGETPPLLWCVVFTLAVGVAWEVFEYAEGITFPEYFSYPIDTAKDLGMNVIGAVIGWSLGNKLRT